jgi:site-specific recombinase XerD
VRKFGEKTRNDYIRHVAMFAKFLGRSPDTATAEDVRRCQVHLTENGVQPPTLNSLASALRFFFGTTLDRAGLTRHLARVHYPRKLPRVLSPEEVGRLLEAAPRLRSRWTASPLLGILGLVQRFPTSEELPASKSATSSLRNSKFFLTSAR